MKSYEKVVMDFLREKFGHSIANQLIERELKIHGLNSISELNSKSQVSFFENFMRKRYSQFLSKEEIDSRIIQLNLHYCYLKASEKISNELKNKITIEPFEIKIQSPNSVLSKLKTISQNSIPINVKISGDISAETIFFFSIQNAKKISQLLGNSFGIMVKEDEINKNILKKFLNVILPSIFESASQLFGNSISFLISEEELSNKVENPNENEMVFFSEIPLKLNSEELSFNIMVILKK